MFMRGMATQQEAVLQILKSLQANSKPTQVFSLSAQLDPSQYPEQAALD